MTEPVLLFPQINKKSAAKRYVELNGVFHREGSFEALKNYSNTEMITRAFFTPTGGERVGVPKLDEIRQAIRETAIKFGYPESVANKKDGAAFDREIGTKLFTDMGIVPGEAAREGVWAFLTLYVVPEIAPWRWGTYTPRGEKERFVHPNRVALNSRNTLMKCWWAAWSLGPDLNEVPDGCSPLGEDERTSIIERPSLMNQRTTKAMRDTIWRLELAGYNIPRSRVARRFGLRILAENTSVMFGGLDDDELRELFDSIMKKAIQDIIPYINQDEIDLASIQFNT